MNQGVKNIVPAGSCLLVIIFLAARPIHASTLNRTGYAFDARCTTYQWYDGHPESPQRVQWIHNRLVETGTINNLHPITPIADPMPHIRRVHTTEHIEGIHAIPPGEPGSQSIGPIADLAVACILGAVEAVCSGTVQNAFCNIRPPGHHVVNGGSISGFCAFANIVIAARFAQVEMGLQRILILDWDYHHGNGTVQFICNDTDVMFFEAGCGMCEDSSCNEGKRHIFTRDVEGEGTNKEYLSVWEQHLVPAADAFRPELVLISSGFDLKRNDGLGAYDVTAHGVSQLTAVAYDIARRHCNGRLVSILEGGYYDRDSQWENFTWHGLSQCAENHVKTLMTGRIQPETPYFRKQTASRAPAIVSRRLRDAAFMPGAGIPDCYNIRGAAVNNHHRGILIYPAHTNIISVLIRGR